MDYVAQFIAYATAFERAFESDDWDAVAAHFAEGASYRVPFPAPLGGYFEGRDAIVSYLRQILDGFDRRFATRSPELLRLTQSGSDGSVVEIRGRVSYTHPEAPDLVFELDEVARFDGPAIVQLEDRYSEEDRARMLRYIAVYGPKLGMLPVSA